MLIEFLREDLKNRQSKNPRYSLRAFAKTLKIDAATLSRLLNGKRQLSMYLAQKIVVNLEVDENQRQDFLRAVPNPVVPVSINHEAKA